MSTTREKLLDQVTLMREENARILEEVGTRGENAPLPVVEMASIVGRFLDTLDESLLTMGDALVGDEPDAATPLAELAADVAAEARSRSVPSPDALFAQRRIAVIYDRSVGGFYARRFGVEREPCYALTDAGWDEWRPSMRPARVFATELEARAVAAATACPGETIPDAPDRIAFIIIADCAHEPEGISITAHFDQRPSMPFDLANAQGAHRVAMDALRFLGGATGSREQIERGLSAAAAEGGGR